jgi:inorganic pyrophosphatase
VAADTTGRETIVEVLVEIPKGSRNKYEFDHERGVMRLDRRLFSATTYPADYGFIPDTLAGDGDPLDALVLIDDPTFPGCLIRARPLGVFFMEDEKGPDAKIICVVHEDPLWRDVKDIEQLPSQLLEEIHHFFDVYKMLEPDKTASTIGYKGLSAALDEIDEARRRGRERMSRWTSRR